MLYLIIAVWGGPGRTRTSSPIKE